MGDPITGLLGLLCIVVCTVSGWLIGWGQAQAIYAAKLERMGADNDLLRHRNEALKESFIFSPTSETEDEPDDNYKLN